MRAKHRENLLLNLRRAQRKISHPSLLHLTQRSIQHEARRKIRLTLHAAPRKKVARSRLPRLAKKTHSARSVDKIFDLLHAKRKDNFLRQMQLLTGRLPPSFLFFNPACPGGRTRTRTRATTMFLLTGPCPAHMEE